MMAKMMLRTMPKAGGGGAKRGPVEIVGVVVVCCVSVVVLSLYQLWCVKVTCGKVRTGVAIAVVVTLNCNVVLCDVVQWREDGL